MIFIKDYVINFSVLLSIIYFTGFMYKRFLVNSEEKLIIYTLILIAILSGWSSMFFGIHLPNAVIFDLRFIPIIIATMYSRNPLHILLIASGIGLARFSFGITEASLIGFITLLLLSGIGMILNWFSRSWQVYTKIIVIVLVLNIVNTIAIVLLGVMAIPEYLIVMYLTSVPINIIFSFLLVWMVKDLRDEFSYKIHLLNSARKDPLTQLFNRRAFKYYYQFYTSNKRDNYPLSVVFIDIDYFKKVNDQYGHVVGDIVLQKVSKLISNQLRNIDIISRYGGEEFVVILPACSKEDVLKVIEQIRLLIESTSINVNDDKISITISAGVASTPEINAKKLLEKADEALYRAKENGRNQVKVATAN